METLYSSHLHSLRTATALATNNITMHTIGAPWTTQGGLVALGVVLGSSISLVGLAFSFITYSLFSDLRSLAGTTLLSLLASLFMGQLLFVIGVGGVQDVELCIAISLALLFMKLATFCWMCCCCHNALTQFSSSAHLFLRTEGKMARTFFQYRGSLLSWGFPLLMVAVAAAFKYNDHEHEHAVELTDPLVITALDPEHNCWLMKGSAYTWGFLLPASVLWCTALWLSCHAKEVAKIAAGMQVDARVRSKLAKRRNLQINLFVRMLMVFGTISLCGAIASIWNVSQFWSLYSIGQGLQGIITTLLVTCNCKILKLYTTPRLHKSRKGHKYAELQDGHIGVSHGSSTVGGANGDSTAPVGFGSDSSRYAVLSVANPNYKHDSMEDGGVCEAAAHCRTDDDDDDDDDDCLVDDEANVFGDHRHHRCHQQQQQQHHHQSSCLLQMAYNDDLMCDRPQQQQQRPQIGRSGAMMAAAAAQSVVFDRLVVDGLPVKDLMDGPVPQPV